MTIVILNILCVIMFTLNVVISAVQKKWMLTAVWSFCTLLWVGNAILTYQIHQLTLLMSH